jgi:hypothetical protein
MVYHKFLFYLVKPLSIDGLLHKKYEIVYGIDGLATAGQVLSQPSFKNKPFNKSITHHIEEKYIFEIAKSFKQ